MSKKLQMNEDKIEVQLVTAKYVVNLQHFPEFMNINGTCVKFSPLVSGCYSQQHTFMASACHECV